MIGMLDEKKIAVAKCVKNTWEHMEESAAPGDRGGDPCNGCSVGGGCINMEAEQEMTGGTQDDD